MPTSQPREAPLSPALCHPICPAPPPAPGRNKVRSRSAPGFPRIAGVSAPPSAAARAEPERTGGSHSQRRNPKALGARAREPL